MVLGTRRHTPLPEQVGSAQLLVYAWMSGRRNADSTSRLHCTRYPAHRDYNDFKGAACLEQFWAKRQGRIHNRQHPKTHKHGVVTRSDISPTCPERNKLHSCLASFNFSIMAMEEAASGRMQPQQQEAGRQAHFLQPASKARNKSFLSSQDLKDLEKQSLLHFKVFSAIRSARAPLDNGSKM